jgi:hypothetical protein
MFHPKTFRFNTRILEPQKEYIEAVVKLGKTTDGKVIKSQGEITRVMYDYYIKSHPLNKKKNAGK